MLFFFLFFFYFFFVDLDLAYILVSKFLGFEQQSELKFQSKFTVKIYISLLSKFNGIWKFSGVHLF